MRDLGRIDQVVLNAGFLQYPNVCRLFYRRICYLANRVASIRGVRNPLSLETSN